MNQPDQIIALLDSIRRGPAFVTNCFLEKHVIRRLAADGRLQASCLSGVVWMFRREDTFRRLYFSAPCLKALHEAAFNLPLSTGEVLTDIIGHADNVQPLAAAFGHAGFSLYDEFQRFVRTADGLPATKNAGLQTEAEAEFAGVDDASRIHQLITTSFDARAEHLPTLPEIEEAVAQHNVLVVRRGTQIAALLLFSRCGLTTILRFWLVRPQFRGMGLGDMLARRYFAECGACRRFLLWVRCGNHSAIRRYYNYGFRQDGATDRIMRKVS